MADPAEKPIEGRLALVAEGLLTIAETGAFLRVSRATRDPAGSRRSPYRAVATVD